MSVDFVAVDFETWNSNPDSMCQFGLVKVKDGKVVDSLCRYVSPLIVAGPSSKMMVKKNGGIDEDTVAGEEPFGRLFEDFIRFCGRMPLVAHNASFDRRVLKQTCWGFDLPIPHYKWYDTLYLSRAFNEMTPGGGTSSMRWRIVWDYLILTIITQTLMLAPARESSSSTRGGTTATVLMDWLDWPLRSSARMIRLTATVLINGRTTVIFPAQWR